MSAAVWGALRSGPLGLLVLAFPGAFLPLDLIYAGPGIRAYATLEQAARIFLYSAALAALLSLVACAVLARAPAAALRLALVLITFALAHGMVLWSALFLSYSPGVRVLLQWMAFALAVPAGVLLALRMRDRHVESLLAVLRASTSLAALAAVACVLFLAARPGANAVGGTPTPAPVAKPSIFLITVDALSAMYLPMYGYAEPTAPRLAQFADEATVFVRNYANSNFTTPAVNSIMLGTRPWTHRALQLEAQPAAAGASLPGLLKAAGYFTASVSTNPWAAPRNLGISGSFSALSENNVCTANDPLWVLTPDLQVAVKSSLAWRSLHAAAVRAMDELGLCAGRHFDPQLAFAEARRIVAEAPAGRPLFLWIHLFPPHDPYVTPAPFLGTFAGNAAGRDRVSTIPPYVYEARSQLDFPGLWRLRYQEAIRYVDHYIGGFLDELRASGRYAGSLVIVTADHGESFSKNYGGHGGPGLHEELVRIPLLIKEPGQTAGQRVNDLSEQVDLLPTILELASIDARAPTEGVSLLPALRGRPLERAVFSMNFQQSPRMGPLHTGSVAMVDGRWKYVRYFGSNWYPLMPRLDDSLYDLAADPIEASNRIAAEPAVAAAMRKEIEAKLGRHGAALR
jgi:arylsulfatase A-like enzyme